jgi:hypothetical protein
VGEPAAGDSVQQRGWTVHRTLEDRTAARANWATPQEPLTQRRGPSGTPSRPSRGVSSGGALTARVSRARRAAARRSTRAGAPTSAGDRSSHPTRRWRAARGRAQLPSTHAAPGSGCSSASPRRAADRASEGTAQGRRRCSERAHASADRPRGSQARARPRATSWWGAPARRPRPSPATLAMRARARWRMVLHHESRCAEGKREPVDSPASPPAICRSHPCPRPCASGGWRKLRVPQDASSHI